MLINSHIPQLQEIGGVSSISELVQRLNQNFSALASAYEQQVTKSTEYITINLFALLNLPGLNSTDQYGISDSRWSEWESQVEADYAQYNSVCSGSASLSDYRALVQYFYENIYLKRLRNTFNESELTQTGRLSPFWLYDCLGSSTIRERKRLINAHLDYHPGRWGIYTRIQSPRVMSSCFSLPILHIDPRTGGTCSIIFYLTSPSTIQVIESLESIRIDDSGLRLDLSGESTNIPATSSQGTLSISTAGLHYGVVSATETSSNTNVILESLDGSTSNLTNQSLVGAPCIFKINSKTSSEYIFSLSSLIWTSGRLGVRINYNTGLSVESSSKNLRLLQLMLSAYSWLPLGGNTKPGLGLAINGSGESQHLIYADNSAYQKISNGRGELMEPSLPEDVQGNWLPKETSQSESTSSISSMLLHIGSIANKSALEYYNSNNPPIPGRSPITTDTETNYDMGLSHFSDASLEIKNGNVKINAQGSPLLGQWIGGDSGTIGGQNITYSPWSERPGLLIEGSMRTPILNITGNLRSVDGSDSGISLWSARGIFRVGSIKRKNDSGGIRILMEGGWSGTGPKMSKLDSSLSDDYGWAAPLAISDGYNKLDLKNLIWFRPARVVNNSKPKTGVVFSRGDIGIDSLNHSYEVKTADTQNKWANIRPDINAFVCDTNPLASDPEAYLFFDWVNNSEQYENSRRIGAVHYAGVGRNSGAPVSPGVYGVFTGGVSWFDPLKDGYVVRNKSGVNISGESSWNWCQKNMFAEGGGASGNNAYNVLDYYNRGPYDPGLITIKNGVFSSIANVHDIPDYTGDSTSTLNSSFRIEPKYNTEWVSKEYILLKANCEVYSGGEMRSVVPVLVRTRCNVFDDINKTTYVVTSRMSLSKGVLESSLGSGISTYTKRTYGVPRAMQDFNTNTQESTSASHLENLYKGKLNESWGCNINIYDSVYNTCSLGSIAVPYMYGGLDVWKSMGDRKRLWVTLETHCAQMVALGNAFSARYNQSDVAYFDGKYVPPAYGSGKVFVYNNPDNVVSFVLRGLGGGSQVVDTYIPMSLEDFNGLENDIHMFFPNNKHTIQLYQDYIKIDDTTVDVEGGLTARYFSTESMPTYYYEFADVKSIYIKTFIKNPDNTRNFDLPNEVVERLYTNGAIGGTFTYADNTISGPTYAGGSKYKVNNTSGELAQGSYSDYNADPAGIYSVFNGLIESEKQGTARLSLAGYNKIFDEDWYCLRIFSKKKHKNAATGDTINLSSETEVIRICVQLKPKDTTDTKNINGPSSSAPKPNIYIHSTQDIDVLLRDNLDVIENPGASTRPTGNLVQKESCLFPLNILPCTENFYNFETLVDDVNWGRDIAQKIASDNPDIACVICEGPMISIIYPSVFCVPLDYSDIRSEFSTPDKDIQTGISDDDLKKIWTAYASCWYDFAILCAKWFSNFLLRNHVIDSILHRFVKINSTEGAEKFSAEEMAQWIPGSLDKLISGLSTSGDRLASRVVINGTNNGFSIKQCTESGSLYAKTYVPEGDTYDPGRAAAAQKRVFKIIL